MRTVSIVLALSLTLFRFTYSHAIELTSAFAEEITPPVVSVGKSGVAACSIAPVRLSSLEAANDAAKSTRRAGTEAFSPKQGELRIAGACAGSRYTCGDRYPYCCYSENKGYYCRKDAKHC
jgi:hypothetical protein